jgi:hypothetical protein
MQRVESHFMKRNKIPGHGNYSFRVPQLAYFILKSFAVKSALLEVVDSFYLIFTSDLMGNPLEKSLKLYVSSSGLLVGMFAAILIGERVRVTILYNAP